MNPEDSKFSKEVKEWLSRINRLRIESVAPLIMVFLQKCNGKSIVKLLMAIERHVFIISMVVGRYYYDRGQFLLLSDVAGELSTGKISCNQAIDRVEERTEKFIRDIAVVERIKDSFKERGFYKWRSVRYFFFEYESSLQAKSKNTRKRLDWSTFCEDDDDFSSIEHIYPQNSQKHHWSSKFRTFTTKERNYLRHSLGNLLALSKPKNSSLQDKAFSEKKSIADNHVGYANGSYSEIEVAQYSDWTAKDILERGLKLLAFMESRWNIDLGTKQDKIEILGLKSAVRKI